jgi:hypothetical protein
MINNNGGTIPHHPNSAPGIGMEYPPLPCIKRVCKIWKKNFFRIIQKTLLTLGRRVGIGMYIYT